MATRLRPFSTFRRNPCHARDDCACLHYHRNRCSHCHLIDDARSRGTHSSPRLYDAAESRLGGLVSPPNTPCNGLEYWSKSSYIGSRAHRFGNSWSATSDIPRTGRAGSANGFCTGSGLSRSCRPCIATCGTQGSSREHCPNRACTGCPLTFPPNLGPFQR